ncbi:MAG: class II fructose-bisphosphate aldolase [Anaerolineae bacterium]|nr:class II fructose-bisphosphate aldolase [Anaerolineae bacterium]
MALVTSKELLRQAQREGYAVGAFNANNLEMIQAVIEAAEEEQAPVIVQISEGAIRYAGLAYLANAVQTGARQASVPVVLHLDHGSGFETNVRCLQAGFTSLMFDGSALPYEENVAITALIVRAAHACGIPVEAELGQVLQERDRVTADQVSSHMTNPSLAHEFVSQTGCDSLAIAVGSVHAMRAQEAELDLDRIRACAAVVDVPLVLHGSSGVTEDSIREAIRCGIAKINVGTYIAAGFSETVRTQSAAQADEYDMRKIIGPARDEVRRRVREKIRLFGSSGRATPLSPRSTPGADSALGFVAAE